MVLKEEIFMEKPLGFISQCSSHLVCKPCKALYGLKQAPRAWFEKCFEVLTNLGFKSSWANTSLFTKFVGGDLTFELVYMDDVIIIGSSFS